MTIRKVLLLLAAGLALPVTALAQGKPDFSGTWKFVSSKLPPDIPASMIAQPFKVGLERVPCGVVPGQAGPPGACGAWGIPAQTMVITQTANEITVEGTHFGLGAPMKVTYKLDGSDTLWDAPWVIQSGEGIPMKWKSRARWDGNKLVLYTWNLAPRAALEMRDALSLEGGQLIIFRDVEHGGPLRFAEDKQYLEGLGILTYSK